MPHQTKRSLRRVSTIDAVVSELVDQILSGELAPGERLREVELAEDFGISRQSLRAALAELAHSGIVQKERNKGIWVPVLRRRDIEDLHLVRLIVEAEAFRHLARSPADWPAARRALGLFQASPGDVPWSAVVKADIAFHRAVVDLVGSPRLLRLYDLYAVETGLGAVPARAYFSPAEMAQEHRSLLQAAESGDEVVAVERFRQHLEWGTQELLARLPS